MGTIIGEGITFDDVLLVPSYSQVIPNQVDVSTYLTKKIKLNIPQSLWLVRVVLVLFIKICLSKLRLKKLTK